MFSPEVNSTRDEIDNSHQEIHRMFYIGRFQPFHNGHLSVIQKICEQADELIIGIGSAQRSHTIIDPFTAGERVLMITRVLAMQKIKKMWYVIPIEDIQRNALWVSHIRAMTPPFDAVYSSNPLVARLFFEAQVKVYSPTMHERDCLSGTNIRERMMQGKEWRHLIPLEVVQVIDEIDGVSRICDLMLDDSDVSKRANQ
jgi:nicotinamide-nucleotide adenylyltransferase